MLDKKQQRVLLLAVHAGSIMMKCGAEIYRVEDTITRICKACGLSYVNVFATPTGIFVTVDEGTEESDILSYNKRIHGGNTDLGKISAINSFSRKFTTTDLSVEKGREILDEIDHQKGYHYLLKILGSSLVAAFFAVLFGGNMMDFCAAFVAGAISFMISSVLDIVHTNYFIKGFVCCFFATLMALIGSAVLPGANSSFIIIGTIMLFVPGVAITNSIRDFLSGDMLSGFARMAEAIVIAVSLAAGTGFMMKIWYAAGGLI